LKTRRTSQAAYTSGGEQQMCAIGRALMTNPNMVLLDEPSMGLSPIMVDKIFEVVRDVYAQGVTVWLVEQNASRALSIANRGYVMESGNITMNGDAKLLLDDPRVATVEMFNQLDNGSHNDGVQITVLMEAAHEQGNDMAIRLLLSHPVADAARMIATRDACGRNSLMLLAERGCVDGMRELLTHPAANKSALLSDRVFRPEDETPETHEDGEGIWLLLEIGEPYADGGESALTLAARYAVQNSTYDPLVFLLHWCISSWDEAELSEQQTHLTAVLGLLSGEDADADDAADATMQECVQLLLQLGASDKHVKLTSDMQRIVRRARRDMA